MSELDSFKESLAKYLPKGSVDSLGDYLFHHPIQLKVTRARLTKLGDYRPPYKKKYHRISINGDLNPYHFLWTLIHEIAHYEVFVDHKNTVKPHGIEWQNRFAKLIEPFIINDIFPDSISSALIQHIDSPKASSCSDPQIYKAFASLDDKPIIFLEDIPEGSVFRFGNHFYKKGEKKRTRFVCTKVDNNRQYLVNGIADVEWIK